MIRDHKETPLVSVGVPVYNGERFLAQALDSLLAQTYENFELIISDNASTDGTEDICRGYAQRDPRIRYVRQASNIGAPANWNHVARAGRGVYFKWASANDVCARSMLDECVHVLKTDPGVVLCYGRTELIDECGDVIRLYDGDIDVDDALPSQRFAKVCLQLALNNAQCGVVRHEVLMRTRLDRLYPGGDMALMGELALLGRFRCLPETLLQRRVGIEAMTALLTEPEITRVFVPSARSAIRGRVARLHLDLLRAILLAPIPFTEKVRSMSTVLRKARWSGATYLRELRSFVRP